MRYGSVCSGIEAASVAWEPLGFKPAFFSEIEPFPCAVLAHRWPAVPNHGDFTTITAAQLENIDVLIGGTPCQDFSVAGLRLSLDGDRGNLTLSFVRLIHATRSLFCAVWENVPGVLSTKDNAFGCFLSALVGSDTPLRSPLERGRWPDAGMVSGPWGRAAWRVLDAQYFGVAQRRKRVFLVFCPVASGGDPAAILFEQKGMSGHPAESRCPGQDVAGTISARTQGGGGLGTDFDLAGGLQTVAAFGGNNCSGAIDLATSLSSHGGPHGRLDFASETFVTHTLNGGDVDANHGHSRLVAAACAPPLTGNPYGDHESREGLLVAHTLKGEGFDASEDGTGRQNLIPIAFDCKASSQNGFGVGSVMSTLRSVSHSGSHQNGGGHAAVAFAIQERAGCENPNAGPQGKGWNEEVAFTLEARNKVQATAFALRGREGGAMPEIEGDRAGALRAANGGSSNSYVASVGVRRLLPVECERLQGFPDHHTDIPFGSRKKITAHELLIIHMTRPDLTMEEAVRLAADGPRYKACGNSMAVPVIAWIGRQIKAEAQRCKFGAAA